MARRPDPRQLSLLDLLDAAPPPVDPARWDGRPGETPADLALIRAGLATAYELTTGGGTLQDRMVPYLPRNLRFPVRLVRDAYSSALRPPRLCLSTPACAGLPFVLCVEGVTGLRAEWDGSHPALFIGTLHHAIDLATDADRERLAASMEHTTPAYVSRAASLKICWGDLSVENAAALLDGAEVLVSDDPAAEALEAWMGWMIDAPDSVVVSGRAIVHAVQAGWMRPGRKRGGPPRPRVLHARGPRGPRRLPGHPATGRVALVRCGTAQHHPLVTLETVPCAASPS